MFSLLVFLFRATSSPGPSAWEVDSSGASHAEGPGDEVVFRALNYVKRTQRIIGFFNLDYPQINEVRK